KRTSPRERNGDSERRDAVAVGILVACGGALAGISRGRAVVRRWLQW
ncbi:hypothetical protein A2U01_0100163, partial [Trifolium medium]|nr:hypothetical protein [Trifolium medium]